MYESWIDNQKKEFLKQKRKYKSEMQKYTNGAVGNGSGVRRQKRAARGTTTTNNEGYEKIFYDKLKAGGYRTVDKFLQKLSDEEVCKKVKDDKGGKIDFAEKHDDKSKEYKGTFYHSEYCQPCPDCGVKRKDEKWENKPDDEKCKNIKLYKPKGSAKPTEIKILKSGEKQKEIAKNLKAFCDQTKNGSAGGGGGGAGAVSAGGSVAGGSGASDSKELYQDWQCYKHDEVEKVKREGEEEDEDEVEDDGKLKGAGGLCILKNDKNKKEEKEKKTDNEPEQFQKTFNEFFYFWIGRFLNDSMYWRGKVGGCLKNGTKTCGNQKCKGDCDCFEKWIGQKKTEWGNIVKHFKTQDFGGPGGFLGPLFSSPSNVLKYVLKLEDLFNNIKSGYGDVKETEAINKILEEEKKREEEDPAAAIAAIASGENNTTIDKLLNHELTDAKDCIKKCEEQKTQPDISPERSLNEPPSEEEIEVEEDEDEDEDLDEDVDQETTDETQEVKDTDRKVDGGGEAPTAKDTEQVEEVTEKSVEVCSIVNNVFTDGTTLKNACPT
ncbi:hypothetical protein PFMALIP_06210, partial [Plasmodium falciparum MaliPS096_E11]